MAAARQELTRIAAGKPPVVPNLEPPAKPDENAKIGGKTVEVIADQAGVSKGTVQNVEAALFGGTDKLIEAARAGEITATMAADAA